MGPLTKTQVLLKTLPTQSLAVYGRTLQLSCASGNRELVVFVETSPAHAPIDEVIAVRHSLRHFTGEGHVAKATAAARLRVDEHTRIGDIPKMGERRHKGFVGCLAA